MVRSIVATRKDGRIKRGDGVVGVGVKNARACTTERKRVCG